MTFIKTIREKAGANLQQNLILLAVLEFLIFLVSGVSFSGLHGAVFFDFGVDLFFGFIYLTGIPQMIVNNLWLGWIADAGMLALMFLLYRNPKNHRIGIALIILSFVYYVTLLGYLTHRNYHAGLFMMWFPFIFFNIKSRSLAYEFTRYYLLFFYFSAGFLKILFNSLSEIGHLSNNLINQFKPYFIDGNTGWRTNANLYLIDHPNVAYGLLIGATVIELVCLIGFFSRRWDIWIGLGLLLFHFCNWVIMDIAPIGQLAFVCLLFIGKSFSVDRQQNKTLGVVQQ